MKSLDTDAEAQGQKKVRKCMSEIMAHGRKWNRDQPGSELPPARQLIWAQGAAWGSLAGKASCECNRLTNRLPKSLSEVLPSGKSRLLRKLEKPAGAEGTALRRSGGEGGSGRPRALVSGVRQALLMLFSCCLCLTPGNTLLAP